MLKSNLQNSFIVKRSLSTIKPTVSKLSNGIPVVTKYNPTKLTNTLGIVVGSGSNFENPYNSGVSKLNSNLFQNDNVDINSIAAKQGYELSSVVAKEYQSYLVTSKNSVKDQLSTLKNSLEKNLNVSNQSFEHAQKKLLNFLQIFESSTIHQNERVLDHLHATAFQNTPLSLPVNGTQESVSDLVSNDLSTFNDNIFKTSNISIVNDGNLKHEEFVDALESSNLISSFAKGEKPTLVKQSSFLGSEVRMRDDTLPKAWISIAVEGEPLNSKDFLVSNVAAQIFGKFRVDQPNSSLQGIKLLDYLQEYHVVDGFKHFSLSYQNTGLWGFQTYTSNVGAIDDLIHFTLKQWNRLSISITETELMRGKQLLKLKLASKYQYKTSPKIISNIGNLALQNIPQQSLEEQFKAIDAITIKDVKNWAGKRLWDQDIAIAGAGQIEGLLDYMRIRNDMSMMRW